jgi:YVTN family beta-propeller protein
VTVATDPRIGTELLGYRIEALLGRGGMGVVYRAYDSRLKRNVALKLVAPELSGDERFRARFLSETELAASLEHPNVVPIHDAGEVEGQLYLAMRYVEGSDLKTRLHEEGMLAPPRALAICAQIAAALDAAHERGLVHRDVKPSNVLLDADEHVYLADFGLTRRLAEPDIPAGPGLSLGTPAYVSPEQIEGGEVDGRADLYSLGCLLYECLTRAAPFPRDSELAVLWAHLQEQPPKPSERNPELPEALDPVIARALAKNPHDRYAGSAELVAAAREALGLRELALVRDRRPLLLAAVGLVLTGGAIALALLLGQGGGPTRPSTKPTLTPRVDSLQRINVKSNKLVATIGIGRFPSAVVVGGGAVWAGTLDDQKLVRIDPRTNEITGAVTTGGTEAIAVGYGSVWAPTGNFPPTLAQIDPVTLALNSSANSGYRSVAVGEGSVWTVGFQGLVRVNRAGETVRTLGNVGFDPFVVAVGGDAVWVLDDSPGTVWRVDLAGDRIVASIPLGFDPGGMAFGGGRLWVTNNGGDAVVEIDPATDRIGPSIRVGNGPVGVAFGEGSVWVTNYRDGTVSRVDPSRGAAVATIRVGREPTYLAAGVGGVWVTIRAS